MTTWGTNAYFSKHFLLGVLFLGLTVFGYGPVINYFYHGGGWPLVQIIIMISCLLGVSYMFRSKVPMVLMVVLCFGWIVWWAATLWGKPCQAVL